MALTKYMTQPVPAGGDLRRYIDAEYRKIQRSTDSIIDTTTSLADALSEVESDLTALTARVTTLESNVTWIAPTLQGTWVNYDANTYNPAGYAKGNRNRIFLRGLVKLGAFASSFSNIFVLPSGYRPLRNEIFIVSASPLGGGTWANTQVRPARVDIFPNGQVRSWDDFSPSWISLDGITFTAGQ